MGQRSGAREADDVSGEVSASAILTIVNIKLDGKRCSETNDDRLGQH